MSRKWLYTAITRATELNNVYFMINDKDYEDVHIITDEELKATKIRNYFHRKTVRYADADFKAGRLKDLEGNGYFKRF